MPSGIATTNCPRNATAAWKIAKITYVPPHFASRSIQARPHRSSSARTQTPASTLLPHSPPSNRANEISSRASPERNRKPPRRLQRTRQPGFSSSSSPPINSSFPPARIKLRTARAKLSPDIPGSAFGAATR